MLHVASGGGDLPAFDIGDDGEQAPEVLAQIVDDIDNSMVTDEAVRGSNEVAVHVQSTGECSTGEETLQVFPSSGVTIIPPRLPDGLQVEEQEDGSYYVRLTLSVAAQGAMIAPGLEIEDCGSCPFCLDKPKYGGSGTKRQKCELKQQEASYAAENRGVHIWCTMHTVRTSEIERIRKMQELPMPDVLVAAAELAPIPLVWAYRRKRRARTLPPAYVLSYYCEGRIPLNREHLAISRQRYFKNSRSDLSIENKSKTRRPRREPQVMHNAPGMYMGVEDHDYATMVPMAMSTAHVGAGVDPSMWQMPAGGVCPLVYGQPLAPTAQSGYATSSPAYMSGGMAMVEAQPQPRPLPPAPPLPYGSQSAGTYQGQPQLAIYQQELSPPHGPAAVYNPGMPHQSLMDPVHPQIMMAHGDPELVGDVGANGVGGGYLSHPPPNGPTDGFAMDSSPLRPQLLASPAMHGISNAQMEAEANSWLADGPTTSSDTVPVESRVEPIAPSVPRPSKRSKRSARASERSTSEPPATSDSSSGGMSNKTLDTMLGRLQGQLPKETYEKVITLVRDVQMRRMSLSRSEFLQHFQAICSGGKGR